jgi:hypothetical protein
VPETGTIKSFTHYGKLEAAFCCPPRDGANQALPGAYLSPPVSWRYKVLTTIEYRRPVVIHGDGQFTTGRELEPGGRLPESVYSQAVDALVIGCADVVPVHDGRMLIGLRSREPQPDWWCFGGRMRRGELYQIAAARNIHLELFHGVEGLHVHPDRFVMIGVYNLIWDTRAQEPIENGSHTLSVTMMLALTDMEVEYIRPNDEYRGVQWILPDELVGTPDRFHPCLIEMARAVASRITCAERRGD